MRRARTGTVLLAAVVAAGSMALAGARAQDPPPDGEKPQEVPLDPKTIWPAGLEKLAGRYVFYQVASPGGLWETVVPKNGPERRRQVSINEVPAALREQLSRAEVVISDIGMPTIEASERLSPSKRGMLRFYSESAAGKLTMRGLPGVGGAEGDRGTYSGPVVFRIEHQSHSNPSVTGILQQRLYQEQTWGAATLDYADLTAAAPEPPAPKNGAAPPKPAPAPKPAPRPDDPEEAPSVITNARILRSGVEVFSFIEWRQQGKDGGRSYVGSVRLIREEMKPKEQDVPLRPQPAPVRPI